MVTIIIIFFNMDTRIIDIRHHGHPSSWSSVIMVIRHHGHPSSWGICHHGHPSSWSSGIMVIPHHGHLSSWSSLIMVICHHGHPSSWSSVKMVILVALISLYVVAVDVSIISFISWVSCFHLNLWGYPSCVMQCRWVCMYIHMSVWTHRWDLISC